MLDVSSWILDLFFVIASEGELERGDLVRNEIASSLLSQFLAMTLVYLRTKNEDQRSSRLCVPGMREEFLKKKVISHPKSCNSKSNSNF